MPERDVDVELLDVVVESVELVVLEDEVELLVVVESVELVL